MVYIVIIQLYKSPYVLQKNLDFFSKIFFSKNLVYHLFFTTYFVPLIFSHLFFTIYSLPLNFYRFFCCRSRVTLYSIYMYNITLMFLNQNLATLATNRSMNQHFIVKCKISYTATKMLLPTIPCSEQVQEGYKKVILRS